MYDATKKNAGNDCHAAISRFRPVNWRTSFAVAGFN
jgi:hypothetical protein